MGLFDRFKKTGSIDDDSHLNDSKKDYYVSYHRGAVYSDGSKDARLVLDEKFECSDVQELISNIENNQKFLTCREEDILNLSKDVSLTDFGYCIKDSNGCIVHTSDISHEIALSFNFLLDGDSVLKVLENLGISIKNTGDEEAMLDEAYAEIEKQYSEIAKDLAKDLDIKNDSCSLAKVLDEELVIFKIKLDAPFYSYCETLSQISNKYGVTSVITLNSEVEQIQLFSFGRLDEGLAGDHRGNDYDWEYLMEDYGEQILSALDE